jgi:hypothetical protein
MHLQHKQPPRYLFVSCLAAAVLVGFPEAVVRKWLDAADPNRSFAVQPLDVSHVDQPDFRHRYQDCRARPRADVRPRNTLQLCEAAKPPCSNYAKAECAGFQVSPDVIDGRCKQRTQA